MAIEKKIYVIHAAESSPPDGLSILSNALVKALKEWFNIEEITSKHPENPVYRKIKYLYEPTSWCRVANKRLRSIRKSLLIIVGFSNLKALQSIHSSNRVVFLDTDDEDEIVRQQCLFYPHAPQRFLLRYERHKVLAAYRRITERLRFRPIALSSESNHWSEHVGAIIEESVPVWNGSGQNLLFVGHLGWYPNILAINNVLVPLAESGWQIQICGGKPSRFAWGLPRQHLHPSITVWEDVEDLTLFYQNSRLFICPISVGSGVNIKVAEAFMKGIPCLLSGFSVRGYERYSIDNLFRDFSEMKTLLEKCFDDFRMLERISNLQRRYIVDLNKRNKEKWRRIVEEELEALT